MALRSKVAQGLSYASVIIDTIDYVTRIGNNATRAVDPGYDAHSFSIDNEVTNLGVVFN